MTEWKDPGTTPGEWATADDESPLYLPAGQEHIFAIVTRPSVPANGVALLCLHAAALHMTSHRNRMYTRICREVAGSGCVALRMDYHGTGDSSGVRADRGVLGQTLDDVSTAVRWLTGQGVERIVVVGTCFGALVALVAAAQHEGIISVCLLSPPLTLIETGADVTERPGRREGPGRALSQALRPHVMRLLVVEPDYRRWILRRIRRRVRRELNERLGWADSSPRSDDHVRTSPETLFASLTGRRVPIRALYGEQDPSYLDLLKQGQPSFLKAAPEIIDVTVTPVDVHGFTTLQAQEISLQHVRNCLAQDAGVTLRPPSPRPEPTHSTTST